MTSPSPLAGEEPPQDMKSAHFLMLGAAWLVSLFALFGTVFFASLAWADVISSMRVFWISYLLLVVCSIWLAQRDYNRDLQRIRWITVNLVIVFGAPLLILIGAVSNA